MFFKWKRRMRMRKEDEFKMLLSCTTIHIIEFVVRKKRISKESTYSKCF